MGQKIASIGDVTDYQLCSGCGVCAYLEPGRFRMADSPEFGRRPFLRTDAVAETLEGRNACPGAGLEHAKHWEREPGLIGDLRDGWGPVFGVWEGYATDPEIRRSGSSGGAASALALYCLEKDGMAGVLHTAADPARPYLNQTVVSKSRKEILSRTGSRYAPASPCEGLNQIEQGDGRFVFIGKPCDVAAVGKAQRHRPALAEKLGLTIAFFCAGTPSTQGTLDLLKSVGIDDPERITALRYRGNGWPGAWTVTFIDQAGVSNELSLTYDQSWGFLEKYRQWRCYVCPDHTGEFADVAVGDPWYRQQEPDEEGRSLILARTRHGLELIKKAQAQGYLTLAQADPGILPLSQPNLLTTRGVLWARLGVLRALGAAVPVYSGFRTFRFWCRTLSTRTKLQSLFRTARRVYDKGLTKRTAPREWSGEKP